MKRAFEGKRILLVLRLWGIVMPIPYTWPTSQIQCLMRVDNGCHVFPSIILWNGKQCNIIICICNFKCATDCTSEFEFSRSSSGSLCILMRVTTLVCLSTENLRVFLVNSREYCGHGLNLCCTHGVNAMSILGCPTFKSTAT